MTFINHEDVFGQFRPFSIGFDNIFEELARGSRSAHQDNYPPYNIVEKDSENFTIELAVAGMSKKDIKITKEKNLLLIAGNKGDSSDERILSHRGIAQRNFQKKFTLADDVIISGAHLEDGILSVDLQRVIPEEDKPVDIKIK
jgi:molecular chaperone IbpA